MKLLKLLALTSLFGAVFGASANMIDIGCDNPAQCPLGIGPNQGVVTDSFIHILDAGTINDINIFVNIEHSYIADIDISIIHDGVTVVLYPHSVGGVDRGGNMTDVTFGDEAATFILAGTAPYGPGSFKPEPGFLSAFDGRPLDGQWQLEIRDNFDNDGGQLLDWRVIADFTPPSAAPLSSSALLLLGGLGCLSRMRQRKTVA